MRTTTNGTASTVLIADDQAIVRRGFRSLLNEQANFTVCGEAADQSHAFQLYNKHRPSLVVTSVSLKEGNGLELTKDLVAIDAHAKVLVCSIHDETLFAERALRAGAKGYIDKSVESPTLVKAMQKVQKGQVYLSQRMTDRLMMRLAHANQDGWGDSPLDSLSDRELEVFEEIGQGTTTRQIADKLQLSPKTVETYRENLKQKLHLRNAMELTRHAVQWSLETTGLQAAGTA